MTDYASVLESYTIPEYEIATEGLGIGGIITGILNFLKSKIGIILGLIGALIAAIMKARSNVIKEIDKEFNKINEDMSKLHKAGMAVIQSIHTVTGKVKTFVDFISTSDKGIKNLVQMHEDLANKNTSCKDAIIAYQQIEKDCHNMAFVKFDMSAARALVTDKKYIEGIRDKIDWIISKYKKNASISDSSIMSKQLGQMSKEIGVACNNIINGYTLINKRAIVVKEV